jgi:hypothetical protein
MGEGGMWHVWEEKRNGNKVPAGRPAGKRKPGRQSHNWEKNIKMDLTGRIGECGLDLSSSGRDKWQALVNMAVNFR